MARKRTRPRKRPRRLADDERPLVAALQTTPQLRAAFEQAVERFSDLPGVISIGIGRKFHDRTESYGSRPRATGGRCIVIWVEQKRPIDEIPREERIPSYIYVEVKGRKSKARVPTDVIAGVPDDGEQAAKLPSAGDVRPGRWFLCGKRPVSRPAGTYSTDASYRRGTPGAVFMMGNTGYAVTSAHVVIKVSGGTVDMPTTPRGIGARRRTWLNSGDDAFFPSRIRQQGLVNDAVVIRLPDAHIPTITPTFPPSFDGTIATLEDIESAQARENGAFFWIERDQTAVALPGKLLTGMTGVSRSFDWGTLRYDFVWITRYTEDATKKGDSGSGVFIEAADEPGVSRLLGFHFFMTVLDGNVGPVSLSVDADSFLRSVVGEPGTDFEFVT
ncbi:MAG: hypothetical protein AAF432_08570 [Planctomycetota bacterium]